jgi:hypothetical protein
MDQQYAGKVSKPCVSREWFLYTALMLCALIGLLLLIYAIKNSRKQARANILVENQLSEAELLVASNQFEEAARLLEGAAAIPEATNTDEVYQALQRLKNKKETLLALVKLNNAKECVRKGRFAPTSLILDEYMKLPGSRDKEYAQQLHDACKMVDSPQLLTRFLVDLPDAEFNSLTSGKMPTVFARLNDTCGDSIIRKMQQNTEKAEGQRQRKRDFQQWVDHRLYKDSETRRIFKSYFANFLEMLDQQSVTPIHRQELKVVQRLFDTSGFAAFVADFEQILIEVYCPDNYHTNREYEVKGLLEERKGEIVKDVISAVTRELPTQR